MSTIEFVVRDGAGGMQRGTLESEAGGADIALAPGQELSLHLQRSHVLSYARRGTALEVMLVDGETVVIEGFFDAAGTPVADLFLSSGGQLTMVGLVPGAGDLMLAEYVDESGFDKWSPHDDLYFIEVASLDGAPDADGHAAMLGVPLMAGLGGIGAGTAAAGAAALGGAILMSSTGGEEGSDTGGEAGDGGDGNEPVAGGVSSGGGSAGGDSSDGGEAGGEQGSGGDQRDLVVTFDAAKAGGDGTVNDAERAEGVVLTGTATPGTTVRVEIPGAARTVTAAEDGSWSATFGSGAFADGTVETDIAVTVTATDGLGNSAGTAGSFALDTFVNRLTQDGPVEGDDVVNRAEAADGITLTGSVETGATVRVTFDTTAGGGGSVTRSATVAEDGSWSVDFTSAEIAHGSYTASVSIVATDAAGNTSSISDAFAVDTTPPDAPEVEGIGLFYDGVHFVAAGQTDDAVEVYSFDSGANGRLKLARDSDGVDCIPKGTLEFSFDAPVPDGKHLVLNATDAAGNTNATYLVLDETGTNVVDATAQGLSTFNIGTIDLGLADKSSLTLTKQAIDALSDNDNVLVVKGAIDDTVTLDGPATKTGARMVDGEAFDVYSLGGDTELLVGQEITFSHGIA